MPSPLAYSRKRRLILQVVMVLLLCGTLGLAALIRHIRIGPSGVPLPQARGMGLLKMRLPDWDLQAQQSLRPIQGADPHLVAVVATERNADRTPAGRILEVTQQIVDANLKPEDYVAQLYAVPSATPSESIRMVGTHGILLHTGPATTARVDSDAGESQVIACAILPEHVMVTVRVRVAGRAIDAPDIALARQVAKALQVLDPDQ